MTSDCPNDKALLYVSPVLTWAFSGIYCYLIISLPILTFKTYEYDTLIFFRSHLNGDILTLHLISLKVFTYEYETLMFFCSHLNGDILTLPLISPSRFLSLLREVRWRRWWRAHLVASDPAAKSLILCRILVPHVWNGRERVGRLYQPAGRRLVRQTSLE